MSIGGIEWIGVRTDVTADDVASNQGGVGSGMAAVVVANTPSNTRHAPFYARC